MTFVVSLFNDGVGIYEVRNNGGWYDFGFILGVAAVFGGDTDLATDVIVNHVDASAPMRDDRHRGAR